MPVYARKQESKHPTFENRSIQLLSKEHTVISVPDTVVLCNGCNKNIYPEPGYLVYLSKRELDANHAYDIYCKPCLNRYFKGYKLVE